MKLGEDILSRYLDCDDCHITSCLIINLRALCEGINIVHIIMFIGICRDYSNYSLLHTTTPEIVRSVNIILNQNHDV